LENTDRSEKRETRSKRREARDERQDMRHEKFSNFLVQSCFFLYEKIGIANQAMPGLQSSFYLEKKVGEELGECEILL
jgi:hypothetical protein